jgi:hypothetical protein
MNLIEYTLNFSKKRVKEIEDSYDSHYTSLRLKGLTHDQAVEECIKLHNKNKKLNHVNHLAGHALNAAILGGGLHSLKKGGKSGKVLTSLGLVTTPFTIYDHIRETRSLNRVNLNKLHNHPGKNKLKYYVVSVEMHPEKDGSYELMVYLDEEYDELNNLKSKLDKKKSDKKVYKYRIFKDEKSARKLEEEWLDKYHHEIIKY